jgi:hypothetical protein
MDEYVGCKVERNYGERVDQATLGDALVRVKPEDCVTGTVQFKYRSGVDKLLHMMCWSRPEILNALRELSRYMSGASMAHFKSMHRTMKYCIGKTYC